MGIQSQQISQDWMEIGCGFDDELCFNLQQQYKQHMQHQQRNQTLFFDNRNQFSISKTKVNNSNDNQCMAYSWSLASHPEKHIQEIDGLISSQNETLRLTLQKQTRQQLGILLGEFESTTLPLLRQKEEEIAQAVIRTIELEDFLRRLETEKEVWQRLAEEKEAMVVSLNVTFTEMRENLCGFFHDEGEDAGSFWDENRAETEEERVGEEEGEGDGERVEKRSGRMLCQRCNSRRSCMLFLPCRHLCSCKACEAFLNSCPVCTSIKKAVMEVLTS
ncbi:probable BOI-related E3 ubiquitin-protein ligase 3 [Malania oleifera]|uniref:probable BOI-related E3 ubiquitin-protein ligase 3 n=1 Tax=Malania oleifera TaxID=397392 RepID=UPI0025AE5052|nr:probable BOI-related E3 ubiquitin-protein ligase 3 [Malania oleifera]